MELSKNLLNTTQATLQGKPYSQPVATCTPMKQEPRTASVLVDWSTYGVGNAKRRLGVSINLLAQQNTTPLDKVRSVKIDNTFCDVPVYLQFLDTLDTIQCPANGIVIAPVYTNTQVGVLYGEGFFSGRTPKTTVELANFDRQGLYIPGSIGNKITGRYEGLADTGQLINIAFNPINLVAAPDPLRLIAFHIISRPAAAGAYVLSGITINGILPVFVANLSVTIVGDGARAWRSILGYALVPTGTTLSVVMTASANASFSSVAAWSILDWTQLAPYSFDSDSGSITTGTRVASNNVIPGAYAVGGGFQFTASPGIVEYADARLFDISVDSAASFEAAYLGQSYEVNDRLPIQLVGNSLLTAVWI